MRIPDPIKDPHRGSCNFSPVENQEKFLREESCAFSQGINLMETPTNSANDASLSGGFGGGAAEGGLLVPGFDPVLISLIRRSISNLVDAYDLKGAFNQCLVLLSFHLRDEIPL